MALNRGGRLKGKSPPASARHKRAGRIPGVPVGDEVGTTVGKKK